MRAADFRSPTIGIDSVEHAARLLRLWETSPGLKGFFGTVDHKKIGIRYIVTAFIFLALGGIEALVMRLQLAGPNLSLLTPEQYNQLFSTHGMTMIFLYASPILSGFSNYLWPLLLGSRDMAFPAPQRAQLLDLRGERHFPVCRIPDRQRPERRLVQLRAVRRARLQPRPQPGLLFARHGVPRHLDHGRRGQLHRHGDADCARRACRSTACPS